MCLENLNMTASHLSVFHNGWYSESFSSIFLAKKDYLLTPFLSKWFLKMFRLGRQTMRNVASIKTWELPSGSLLPQRLVYVSVSVSLLISLSTLRYWNSNYGKRIVNKFNLEKMQIGKIKCMELQYFLEWLLSKINFALQLKLLPV